MKSRLESKEFLAPRVGYRNRLVGCIFIGDHIGYGGGDDFTLSILFTLDQIGEIETFVTKASATGQDMNRLVEMPRKSVIDGRTG